MKNLRYLDDYVAAQIVAWKEFRWWWLAQTDREFYPLHMDNWEFAFELWLRTESQKPSADPFVPQARALALKREREKLNG